MIEAAKATLDYNLIRETPPVVTPSQLSLTLKSGMKGPTVTVSGYKETKDFKVAVSVSVSSNSHLM